MPKGLDYILKAGSERIMKVANARGINSPEVFKLVCVWGHIYDDAAREESNVR